jgi:signal transduction histidine kinase
VVTDLGGSLRSLRRRLTQADTPPALVRRFSALSLIVIGLVTIALFLVMSHYLQKNLLEREWRTTADFVTAEARFHFDPNDFVAPFTKEAEERFRTFHREAATMPELVRVNIFDATMTLIWSDDRRLIGHRFPDNVELASALAGRTTVSFWKGETPLEQHDVRRVVELYVPVFFSGMPAAVGVVETYKVPAEVFATIRRSWLVVAATSLVGGVILYLSLSWIVRQAARRIESQRALTARLQAVLEEERSSIAHQAREQLAQVLSALKLDLVWMAANMPGALIAERERTTNMLRLLDIAISSALQIANESRPGALDLLGLTAAIESEADRFQARTGLRCHVMSDLQEPGLDQERRTVMFRIFQTALSNVERHARATRVTIGLERDGDHLVLTVQDDGRGISAREMADPTSLGLLSMRESADLLRGEIRITGSPGKGTTLTLRVPVERTRIDATRAP